MPKFECHLFVCCNQRKPGARQCCDIDGKEKLRDRFKSELKKRKLGNAFRVNKAGCLDQCEQGPVIVLYPQQIWYGNVQLDDVERIIDETVIAGRVLPDLLIPDEKLNVKD
jgi:(2Fe-2S) ferredoxin